ncbi:MAG: hypothetical protein JXP34_14615 [Planctomycetes bacterium]|nr:hypothetical protein [Planctomycetota bacterium]
MNPRRFRICMAAFGCVLVFLGRFAVAEPVEIPWRDPAAWASDGMWKIAARDDGLEFLKDEKPAHNSMCWLRLPAPLARGDRLEIAYRLEKPFKHVDLFLGADCVQPRYGDPLPEFAEVFSLGGIPDTDQRLRAHVITGDGTIDTLGFLSWGWREDRNTWLRVARIAAERPARAPEWIAWPVPPILHDRSIPARHPLQDFFPFGVYISLGDATSAAKREGKGVWEWLDEALGDLAARGMNFTSLVNFGQANLDRLAELHLKHGLRMNPQAGEHDLKHNVHEIALRYLKQAIARHRASGVIAGWGAGEEFPPAQVPKLDLAHEIVHAVDPQNTLVTIHNRVEAFRVLNGAADVRIAFRDVYPFFSSPRAGPTTFEASMNYYEDEIDKCKQWLPHGASLWAMPQAQGEFGYIRTPTPAEVKLEAWSAIAHGAQGLAYFIYHSAGEPGRLKFDGLRALDGSPTDRLVALTELAQVLVPLGPLVVRWTQDRASAETDVRSLRAYLFRHPEGKVYAVVYNRNAKEAIKGRIRVPFPLGESVADLVKAARIPVQADGDRAIFPVSLPPGEGTIIFLGPDPRRVPSKD